MLYFLRSDFLRSDFLRSDSFRSIFLHGTASILLAIVTGTSCHAESALAKPVSNSTPASPPLSTDVAELNFRDFFKMPVGPLGLEPSEKLQSLNHKRVRIIGYMVKEEDIKPGSFMLASQPVSLSDIEDGPADDLPATTITVHSPISGAKKTAGYRPGLLRLTGTLELGNQEESNGRISYARLLLDEQKKQEKQKKPAVVMQ